MRGILVIGLLAGMIRADIISKNVFHALIKKDLGYQTYQLHCVACHAEDGSGVREAPLGGNALDRYATVSDLFLHVRKTHADYTGEFRKLDEVGLIFALRYVRDRLEKHK